MDNKRKDFVRGIKAALPIVMGYLPIGIAYGILAVKAGLNTFETVLMSLMVFAGSSQFIAINMIEMNFGFLPIVFTTFLVNLRHLLMSASMGLKLKGSPEHLVPVLSFLITDESFAISTTNIDKYDYRHYYFLGLGTTAYLSWVLSSYIGATIGFLIHEISIPALDFVLPAMFIALLVIQIRKKTDVLIAVVGGTSSLLFLYLIPGNWNIILATITAATLGVIVDDD